MAEAIISFVIEQLGTVLLDEFNQQVRLVKGVREEIGELTRTFKAIKALINDAEQKQIHDEGVKLWLEDLNEVAYDMEDILDEWITKTKIRAHRREVGDDDSNNDGNQVITEPKKVFSFLCSPFSCFKTIPLRHEIASRIQELRERLKLIEDDRVKYQFIPNTSNPNEGTSTRLNTTSIIDVEDICGRDHDEKTILDKLLGIEGSTSNTNRVPQIISIVGMGGLGKTTLAQKVFNHDKVKTYFEKTMWVCVSSPFDIINVAKSIIQEADGRIPQDCSQWNNQLHNSLCASLERKRYLLVLDDVYNEDEIKWNPLRLSLKYGAPESRILVTTRSQIVSDIIGATYQHSLEELSDEDCWSLLSRIAFHERKKEECIDLIDISNQLAKKCKGLPLAAKSLGSLLRFKKTKNEWLGLLKSNIWDLDHKAENKYLKPALLLSYDDLSPRLKGCFQYCATFPKDHWINKDTLIKLWMAHGFLNSNSGSEDLESVGENYFNALAMRSFFQNFSKDVKDGSIEHCKMHDIVHDLTQFLLKNKIFTEEGDRFLNVNTAVHHLTLNCGLKKFQVSSLYKFKKLRTFELIRMSDSPSLNSLFHHLQYLRVLSLRMCTLKSIPSEIGKLVHLRYLDLSSSQDFKDLPDSLCSLYNLQTLKLNGCYGLCQLPRGIGRMFNLRHLEIERTTKLNFLPAGIGKLRCLRTLTKFCISTGIEECKIKELRELNNLRGSLEIEGFDKLQNLNEVSEAQMYKKKHLNFLRLQLNGMNKEESEVEEILGELQPHPNLEQLTILHYLGSKFPSWMGSSLTLPNLRTLELHSCGNCTILPALGMLPSLEKLDIYGLEKLTHFDTTCKGYTIRNSTGRYNVNQQQVVTTIFFPKLKSLCLTSTHELEKLDLEGVIEEDESKGKTRQVGDVITIMPCLKKISTNVSNKLKSIVVNKLLSLQEIEVFDMKEMVVLDYQFTPYLQILHLKRCRMLKSLAVHPHLLKLEISDCRSIFELPNFPNLISLEIYRCPSMSQLPMISPNLISLEISYCPLISQLPMLHKLTSLKIAGSTKISQLQFLPNLTSLHIDMCPSISHLPILTNLTSLKIFDCPSISHLPILPSLTSLTCSSLNCDQLSLPQGISKLKQLQKLNIENNSLARIPQHFRDLTNLRELCIVSDSLREEQYSSLRERADWNIISHIQRITINDQRSW